MTSVWLSQNVDVDFLIHQLLILPIFSLILFWRKLKIYRKSQCIARHFAIDHVFKLSSRLRATTLAQGTLPTKGIDLSLQMVMDSEKKYWLFQITLNHNHESQKRMFQFSEFMQTSPELICQAIEQHIADFPKGLTSSKTPQQSSPQILGFAFKQKAVEWC